jgi:hypothetical protein
MRLSTILPVFLLPLLSLAAPQAADVKDETVPSFTVDLTGDTFESTVEKGVWYVPFA